MELCLKVYDKEGKIVAVRHGEDEVCLACAREYREGDRFGQGQKCDLTLAFIEHMFYNKNRTYVLSFWRLR